MIKNKELLDIIKSKKNEASCENCKHCNLNSYHRGKSNVRQTIVSFSAKFRKNGGIENE